MAVLIISIGVIFHLSRVVVGRRRVHVRKCLAGPEVAQATGLIGVWWRFKPRALSSEKQEEL